MKTYPEMNQKIIDLLKMSDNPVSLYAAERIEELEKALQEIPIGRIFCNVCNKYDAYCGCTPDVKDRIRKEFLNR